MTSREQQIKEELYKFKTIGEVVDFAAACYLRLDSAGQSRGLIPELDPPLATSATDRQMGSGSRSADR